ncbi:MAG: hypothetical protein ACRDJT_02540 [Actinomycetota bacterium]
MTGSYDISSSAVCGYSSLSIMFLSLGDLGSARMFQSHMSYLPVVGHHRLSVCAHWRRGVVKELVAVLYAHRYQSLSKPRLLKAQTGLVF